MMGYKPSSEQVERRNERTVEREEELASQSDHDRRQLASLDKIDWPGSGYLNDVIF